MKLEGKVAFITGASGGIGGRRRAHFRKRGGKSRPGRPLRG